MTRRSVAAGRTEAVVVDAVRAGDLRERLAALDLVLGEAEPFPRTELLERGQERVLGALGQADRPATRRRAEAAQLGVQLAHLFDADARGLGDDAQIGGVRDVDLVRGQRLLVLDLESESLRMLGDER